MLNHATASISERLKVLADYIVEHDYCGYDPYDALNSPIARLLTFGGKYGRISWTQFFRRFPINLRQLFYIPKGYNPKGIGLFLGGYAKLYKLYQKPESLVRIQYLQNLLATIRSVGYSGNSWGYNFDWQSRAFFLPKYTPTIVNTSFVGHSLLDTHELTGNQGALDLAVPIGEFIMNDLHRTVEGDTFCFSYTPFDHTVIHNANLLGASLLIRLSKLTGEEKARETALASLAYSMKYQHDEGSWYYAETDFQQWIDSFHTGFNLESIRWFLKLEEGDEYRNAYSRGVEFYAKNFFLKDGTPKYYHDRTYPIDIHSPAEAVVFFSQEGDCYKDLAARTLNWMLNNMQDPKGYFYFRKGKYFTNKIPYMRWGQAWAFHALTTYLANSDNP